MTVLNPKLYRAMLNKLKHVTVRHPGELAASHEQYNPITQRTERVYVSWGERYIADCPFCGDTRGRLAVCHRYNLVDPITGYRDYSLWKCFNEECQAEVKNRNRLAHCLALDSFTGSIGDVKIPTTELVSTALPAVDTPAAFVSLAELAEDHCAITYLRDTRKFDISELVALWDVGFVGNMPAHSREAMAANRIAIPVVSEGVKIGWQYRCPYDTTIKGLPKYLTFFPKSRALYGLDFVADERVIPIVEGATDAWRYGHGVICRFGKRLSPPQTKLICSKLAGRRLVFITDGDDPEAEAFAIKDCKDLQLAKFSGGLAIWPLKNGLDPANLSREELRKTVQLNGVVTNGGIYRIE